MQYTNYFVGILLLLLAFRFQQFYQTKSNYINGQEITFQTTLMSQPKTSSNQQRLSIVLEDGQRVLVTIPRYPKFHYADTVLISGTLKKRVINNKNIVLAMYFPKIEAVKNDQNSVLALTSRIRQKITTLFQKSLPQSASSLLLGITFGIKEDKTSDFFEKLQATGVLHVVAASGMNVTMVGGVLSSLFMLFLRRQVAIGFTIFGIFLYAILAGLEASIVRASIMGTLVFVAQILGRQYMASYALFLAGAAMLFFDPKLLFDIGFQLSFLATLGLIYIRPVLIFIPKKLFISEDLQTTIAAQIATLPILLSNFGTYSLVSILVNGLVLWTVPILMIIGGVGAVAGLIFEFAGNLILYTSLPFLFYFEQIVSYFATKGSMVTIEVFPWQWSVGYYCLLLAIVFYAQKSRSH